VFLRVRQAFSGGGCVPTGPATQCMCRHVRGAAQLQHACTLRADHTHHLIRADGPPCSARFFPLQLTDFASERKPKIATCSLSDMTSFSFGDIITKLKFLFIVVIVLFGFMNVGAVIGFILDTTERKQTIAKLCAPSMGFAELPGGVWTWACEQTPLVTAVEAPAGSAHELAGVFGLPFVRLRAALPEEMFAGGVGQALGRKAGLSVQGLADAAEDNVTALKQLAASMNCFRCDTAAPGANGKATDKIPEFNDDGNYYDAETGGHALTKAASSQSMTAGQQRPLHAPSTSSDLADFVETPAVSMSRLMAISERADDTLDGMSPSACVAPERMAGTALVFAFIANAKLLPVVELSRRTAAASAHFEGVRMPGLDWSYDELYDKFLVMLSPGNLSSRGDWLEKGRLWRFILLQRTDGAWDLTESLAFALEAHAGERPPRAEKRGCIQKVLGALAGGDLDDAIDDAADDLLTSSDDDGSDEERAADKAAYAQVVKDCPLSFTRSAIRHRLPRALTALNADYHAAVREAARAEAAAREAAAAAAAERKRVAEEAAALAAARAIALRQGETLQPDQVNPLVALVDGAGAALQYSLENFMDNLTAVVAPPGGAPRPPRPQGSSCSLRPRSPSPEPGYEPAAEYADDAYAEDECAEEEEEAGEYAEQDTFAAQPAKPSPSQPAYGSSIVVAPRAPGPMARCDSYMPGPSAAPAAPLYKLSQSASGRKVHRRVRPRVPIERIWSTVLAMNRLEEMDSSWLVEDIDEPMRTIVDHGREFLEAASKADKRVRKLLRAGTLQAAAEKARKDWGAIQEFNVKALRDADVINRFTALTHLQRASARVVRSMMTDHSTFATFLDTDGYIMRWQRFMILLTLVMSTLLTSIWFYCASPPGGSAAHAPAASLGTHAFQRCMRSARIVHICSLLTPAAPIAHMPRADSRGFNCCAEIRMILDCDPVGECMGFAGECGQLQEQFLEVQGPYIYGTPPEEHMYLDEYVCTQFPDDAMITDQILVGLICIAVALPVDWFLAGAFETANEGDCPECWLDAPAGKIKLLVGKDAHKGWHLAKPGEPVSDFVLWLVRGGEEDSILGWITTFLGWAWGRVFGAKEEEEEEGADGKKKTNKEGEEEEDDMATGSGASHASSEARSDARMKRLYASAGLVGVYICWAIFSWFIFTYGMLIYRNLGPNAQNEFSKQWGIGYGMNSATEWQDVAITAAKAALLIVILDALRVSKNSSWFEEHGACTRAFLRTPPRHFVRCVFPLADIAAFLPRARPVDFVSMQAVLFTGAYRSWWAQTHALVKLQARLTED
jgi:hypothetical protein